MMIAVNDCGPRTTAFIGMGSNLERPVRQLASAIEAILEIPDVSLKKVSSFYETAPVGIIDQPNFVNAVAEIETTLMPGALLKQLLNIEAAHARVRTTRNGPRTLDLDILLYGDVEIRDDVLTIPHPRMHERAFVLVPLAEIAPDVQIPGHGSVARLLSKLDTKEVKRMGEERSRTERI
jgi:2-amino-4-hydroxy-6-hydroxymethyldihydropteridine diphosphokinase